MTTPARPEEGPAAQPEDLPTSAELTPLDTSPSAPTYVGPAPGEEVPALPSPFGRYGVVRRLGRGGMGTVYLARDTQLDRLVALKVPLLEGSDRTTLRARFLREACAAALLHHPHICPVYDVGEHAGVPYLTMAYID